MWPPSFRYRWPSQYTERRDELRPLQWLPSFHLRCRCSGRRATRWLHSDKKPRCDQYQTYPGSFNDPAVWTAVGEDPDRSRCDDIDLLGRWVDRLYSFNGSEHSKRLDVLSRNVTLDFNGKTYQLHGFQTLSAGAKAANFNYRALVVRGSTANSDGSNAVLRLRDGTLLTPDAWIDGNPTSSIDYPQSSSRLARR